VDVAAFIAGNPDFGGSATSGADDGRREEPEGQMS
jgi:hypothetical protein